MYDDRKAFDITQVGQDIENALQATPARRTRGLPPPTIRRHFPEADIQDYEPTPTDTSAVAEEPRAEDAPQARPALLEARENTHGSFANNARVSQAIKRIFRAEPGWDLLTDVERESMDMVALKFSRILSGKSLELQHWEDVVGYAKLAEEQCKPA